MQVLAGDIGGTKSLLCVAECGRGATRIVRQQRFENADYPGFAYVLRDFLAAAPVVPVSAACFAIAGPVRERPTGQFVKVTNLPWQVDGAALALEFDLPRVRLVNDFAAIGYAIESLRDDELLALHAGEPEARGPRAVIGAGTGLGQAILFWHQDHYEVIATEGSKADFGPTDAVQLELARYLIERHGRASYEMVLSGAGQVRLYEFLRDRHALAPERPALATAMRHNDPAAAITRAALEHNDPLANAALDLFVKIYGAQAGNLALAAGATGGVYVAGGIAPKIVARLTDGTFVRAFVNKGKMTDYVNAIPVSVVMNPEVGLAGAVAVAARLAREA
jgi:glucokinase